MHQHIGQPTLLGQPMHGQLRHGPPNQQIPNRGQFYAHMQNPIQGNFPRNQMQMHPQLQPQNIPNPEVSHQN